MPDQQRSVSGVWCAVVLIAAAWLAYVTFAAVFVLDAIAAHRQAQADSVLRHAGLLLTEGDEADEYGV